MLNVRLLGTGSPPPNPKRRGPATLVTLENEHFLVDAGSGVGVQLVQAGLRPYDWPRVFITHHHSDHVIDLAHLLVTRWIVGQNAPFEVWGPAGTRSQVDKLMDYLKWDLEIRRQHMEHRALPEARVTEIEEGAHRRDRRRPRVRLPRRARSGQAGVRLPLRGRRAQGGRVGRHAAVREPHPLELSRRLSRPRVLRDGEDVLVSRWGAWRARQRRASSSSRTSCRAPFPPSCTRPPPATTTGPIVIGEDLAEV